MHRALFLPGDLLKAAGECLIFYDYPARHPYALSQMASIQPDDNAERDSWHLPEAGDGPQIVLHS